MFCLLVWNVLFLLNNHEDTSLGLTFCTHFVLMFLTFPHVLFFFALRHLYTSKILFLFWFKTILHISFLLYFLLAVLWLLLKFDLMFLSRPLSFSHYFSIITSSILSYSAYSLCFSISLIFFFLPCKVPTDTITYAFLPTRLLTLSKNTGGAIRSLGGHYKNAMRKKVSLGKRGLILYCDIKNELDLYCKMGSMFFSLHNLC